VLIAVAVPLTEKLMTVLVDVNVVGLVAVTTAVDCVLPEAVAVMVEKKVLVTVLMKVLPAEVMISTLVRVPVMTVEVNTVDVLVFVVVPLGLTEALVVDELAAEGLGSV